MNGGTGFWVMLGLIWLGMAMDNGLSLIARAIKLWAERQTP